MASGTNCKWVKNCNSDSFCICMFLQHLCDLTYAMTDMVFEYDPSITMEFNSLSRATRVSPSPCCGCDPGGQRSSKFLMPRFRACWEHQMSARVVIVCVDEAIGDCPRIVARLKELEEQRCAIVPVILPGYKITNYTRCSLLCRRAFSPVLNYCRPWLISALLWCPLLANAMVRNGCIGRKGC